jgi:FkbM family methyltransferase
MMRSLLDWYRSKKFKRAKDRWFKDRGDSTLRLDYPLDPSSIVFDVGGFRGDFAAQIHERYQCQIHVFEPVKQYYNEIKRRFSQKPQIKVHPFGLGAKNQEILINLQDDGSSFVKKSEGSSSEVARIISIQDFLEQHTIPRIDLLKVNIEGGEFELLDSLLDTGLIQLVEHLQVQFHLFVPDATRRRGLLRKRISITHELTYDYYFIWENWKKRS